MGQLTFARIVRSNSLPVNFSDFFVQKSEYMYGKSVS